MQSYIWQTLKEAKTSCIGQGSGFDILHFFALDAWRRILPFWKDLLLPFLLYLTIYSGWGTDISLPHCECSGGNPLLYVASRYTFLDEGHSYELENFARGSQL